jgi:imidazolonepropionase-like amidohydrolase
MEANMRQIVIAGVFVLSVFSSAQELSTAVKSFVKLSAPVIVLTHVRLIDGTGVAPLQDQTIVIHEGKVESISGAANATFSKDALMIDLHGHSVIPGLVGMHDHMFYGGVDSLTEMPFSFPRLYLAAGVTTVRTTGALDPYTDLGLRDQINKGLMPGPKLHVTGPFLEGNNPWGGYRFHALAGPKDAEQMVNFWLDQGVEDFKAYMFITHDELSAAIATAHKRGAKITGHLCSIGFREAADLGIDGLEHGLVVDTEFAPDKKPGVCDGRVFDDPVRMSKLDVKSGPVHDLILYLVAHHVSVTSTLPVEEIGAFPGRPPIRRELLDVLSPDSRNAFLQEFVIQHDERLVHRWWKTDVTQHPRGAALKKEMEFEYAFSKAGGLLLAGLDPTGAGGIVAGFGDQREVELLVEAGFTPVEAIHIATYNGAEYLGQLDHIGTIGVGKQADIVVIKGDPSTNINDIENVETVFKDGVGYDPVKLIESVKGQVGIQ